RALLGREWPGAGPPGDRFGARRGSSRSRGVGGAMKRFLAVLCVLVPMVGCSSASLPDEPVSEISQAATAALEADTTVVSTRGDNNSGESPVICAGVVAGTGAGGSARALVRFTISSVPSANVASATLTLTSAGNSGGAVPDPPPALTASRATVAFVEG